MRARFPLFIHHLPTDKKINLKSLAIPHISGSVHCRFVITGLMRMTLCALTKDTRTGLRNITRPALETRKVFAYGPSKI